MIEALAAEPRPLPYAGGYGGCKVLPSLEHDRPCGRRTGARYALGYPICDECFEAIKEDA